jgi:hypothetical protein
MLVHDVTRDLILRRFISSSYSVELNNGRWLLNWKGYGRKRSWHNLRHSPCVFLERLRKTAKTLPFCVYVPSNNFWTSWWIFIKFGNEVCNWRWPRRPNFLFRSSSHSNLADVSSSVIDEKYHHSTRKHTILHSDRSSKGEQLLTRSFLEKIENTTSGLRKFLLSEPFFYKRYFEYYRHQNDGWKIPEVICTFLYILDL